MIFDEKVQKPWMKGKILRLVNEEADLRKYFQDHQKSTHLAVDLETTGLDNRTEIKDGRMQSKDKIVGFCLCFEPKESIYIPVAHLSGKNLPTALVVELLKEQLKTSVFIFHHAKFDQEFLYAEGLDIQSYKEFEDTMLMAYIIESTRSVGLKTLARECKKWEMIEFDELFAGRKGKKADQCIADLDPDDVYIYGASDALVTRNLFDDFKENEWLKKQETIYILEKRVVPVVRWMERNRIKVNSKAVLDLHEKLTTEIQETTEKIYEMAGINFNIGSPKQLSEVLFKKLSLRAVKETKTGFSTADDVLEELKNEHPIVPLVQVIRSLSKLKSSYIDSLQQNVDEEQCGRLNFKQNGADTGRFSSPASEVDRGSLGVAIQTIPKTEKGAKYDLRRLFVARDGYKFVSLDYSAEELRIAANLSGETVWAKAFNERIDPHRMTAKVIFAVKTIEEVTSAQRSTAKAINFATLYGSSPAGIAYNLGIEISKAEKIIERFFKGVPTLKSWIEKQHEKMTSSKYVATAFGRLRRAVDIDFKDRKQLGYALRVSVNAPIQGTAADVIKIAMVKIYDWIKNDNLFDVVRMIATVHDELLFEVRKERAEELGLEIARIMESIKAPGWIVPLEVEGKIGPSWSSHEKEKELTLHHSPHEKKVETPKSAEEFQKPVETAPPPKKEAVVILGTQSGKTQVARYSVEKTDGKSTFVVTLEGFQGKEELVPVVQWLNNAKGGTPLRLAVGEQLVFNGNFLVDPKKLVGSVGEFFHDNSKL